MTDTDWSRQLSAFVDQHPDLDLTTDLLVSRQVGEILGIDKATVIRRIAAGKLQPIFKMPGTNGPYVFYRADIEAVA